MKNSPKYAACETKLLKCHEAKDTEIILKKLELEVLPPTIVYMASLPLEANVLFMTVMATNMPFIGRG